MPSKKHIAAAIGAALVLVPAASAHAAATVTTNANALTYRAAPGERNIVFADFNRTTDKGASDKGADVFVRDDLLPVQAATPIGVGGDGLVTGCAQPTEKMVHCFMPFTPGGGQTVFSFGNKGDTATVRGIANGYPEVIVHGETGNDTLTSGMYNLDDAAGGTGAGPTRLDEILDGGAGNDVLRGSVRMNDTLLGGTGADIIREAPASSSRGTQAHATGNSVLAGGGNDQVNMVNGLPDAIDCGSGKQDSATIERGIDHAKHCERITRKARKR
jgi:hypothetical protein